MNEQKDFSPADWVERFRESAGRHVIWTVRSEHATHRFAGRIPLVRHWRDPDDPYLLLRPGSTDAVHVLADMELRLIERDGRYGIARRRWHEQLDLDETPLGPGPIVMTLEPLG